MFDQLWNEGLAFQVGRKNLPKHFSFAHTAESTPEKAI